MFCYHCVEYIKLDTCIYRTNCIYGTNCIYRTYNAVIFDNCKTPCISPTLTTSQLYYGKARMALYVNIKKKGQTVNNQVLKRGGGGGGGGGDGNPSPLQDMLAGMA